MDSDEEEILAIIEAVNQEIQTTKKTTVNPYFIAKVCNFYIKKHQYNLKQISLLFNIGERTLSSKLAVSSIKKFVDAKTSKPIKNGLYDLSHFRESNFLTEKAVEIKEIVNSQSKNLGNNFIKKNTVKKSLPEIDEGVKEQLSKLEDKIDGIFNFLSKNSPIISINTENKSFKEDYNFNLAEDKIKITFYLQRDLEHTVRKIIADKSISPSLFYNEAIYGYILKHYFNYYENSFDTEK